MIWISWGDPQKCNLAVDQVTRDSHAAKIGMEVGWLIKEVEGEDVSNNVELAQRALIEGMAKLPEA